MRPLFIALSLLLLFAYASFDSEQITRINEHISYHRVWVTHSNARTQIGYLKIAQYNAHYSLAVTIPQGGIGTLETLEKMVQANFAIAGINANFFDKNTTIPIGLLIKDGVVLSTNYGQRAALYIDLFGDITFVRPSISLFLKVGGAELLRIEGVNRPPKGSGLFLYTPEYTLPIRLNGELAQIIKIRNNHIFSIFESGLVLPDGISNFIVATGTAKGRSNKLTRGERAQVIYTLDPPGFLIRDAISAGPMLLQRGQIVLDPEGESFDDAFIYNRAARSALARTSNGDLILLVVFKSRSSAGMNLFELALFLKQLGAQDAMALDGGGSSALAFRQGFQMHQVGGTRKIAVGLVIIPK